jgi:hypothetical protein
MAACLAYLLVISYEKAPISRQQPCAANSGQRLKTGPDKNSRQP